ncbi:hypothetical protein GJ496_003377 [Pomphorhynchus laevis]|nr:hypothetical protein GJ496_003377 [Pomphorhynchus laevis]
MESSKSLEEFVQNAKIMAGLKLTFERSEERINFLDVMIFRAEQSFETVLYRKHESLPIYLHANSDHPRSIKRNVIYNEGHRMRRICSPNKNLKGIGIFGHNLWNEK